MVDDSKCSLRLNYRRQSVAENLVERNSGPDVQRHIVWMCKKSKTYNTEDSQVVTDPSTNSALCCLYMGERTGSLAFSRIWSYVLALLFSKRYIWKTQ